MEVIEGCNCRSDLWTFISTEEQKGWKKRSRGTNDLLYINRGVFREVSKKNLAMAEIDYKNAYDIVQHSWIKAGA